MSHHDSAVDSGRLTVDKWSTVDGRQTTAESWGD